MVAGLGLDEEEEWMAMVGLDEEEEQTKKKKNEEEEERSEAEWKKCEDRDYIFYDYNNAWVAL